MNKSNSIDAIDQTNWSEKTKFWLVKLKIVLSSKLIKENKYVAAFDYTDKILIVLSATAGGISICSFTSIVGAPVGIASASFTLISSLTAEITKKLLNITRRKKAW